MEVYITKYALTTGIYTEIAHEINDKNIAFIKHNNHFYSKDWHKTLIEAQARAEEMRVKKIASLKKQIKKLETMTFEFKN